MQPVYLKQFQTQFVLRRCKQTFVLLLSCNFVFTALHGMPAQTSYEKAVRPSVRLSVKRVDCDKTEESSAQIFYTI